MKITIIGGGNMGQAFARGLALSKEFEITVSNPDLEKIQDLKSLGIQITSDNKQALEGSEVVMIAVKPNVVKSVLQEISETLTNDVLLISIAAGISTSQIEQWSNSKQIIRVMPNTPALIGKGISAWFASTSVSKENKSVCKNILKAVGEEMEVSKEELIDAATAICGCGPAYVFYFLEALTSVGTELGLTENEAKKLACATFEGASILAQTSKESLETLRANVTSKGGTTEAALNFMEENQIKKSFAEAVKKAHRRAQELRDQ